VENSIIASELLEENLGMVQQWCDRTQLLFNPMVVTFTRKRDLRGHKEPTILGHKLQLATELKYLRLIRPYRAFWTCRGPIWQNLVPEA